MSTKTLLKTTPYGLAAGLSYGMSNFPQYFGGSASNGSNNSLRSMAVGPWPKSRRQGRRGRRTSFKSRVMAIAPAYHLTVPDSSMSTSLLHNGIYTYNVTAQVVQGTANSNRQGDAIQLLALKLKGVLSTGSPVGAYQIRIIVGWSGEEYNPATLLSSGLGATEVFLPGSSNIYVTNGIVNPKAFTVIYDEVTDMNSVVANAEQTNIEARVKLSGKFPYQSSAAVYGKTKNLYILAMAIVNGGTSGVTTAGGITMSADLIFKNL